MKSNSILIILISLSLISCVPEQDTDFSIYSAAQLGLDDVDGSVPRSEPGRQDGEPYSGDPVGDGPNYDGDPEEGGPNYDGDPEGDDPEQMVKCDFDLRVTSANVSNTKIVIGSLETIKLQVAKLAVADKDYFSQGLNGQLALEANDFRKTSHSDSLTMAFAGDYKYKVTSSHGQEYRFYSEGSFEFDTTSSKSDKVILLAHDKLVIDTTNYDVDDAVFMLVTNKQNIKVCIRETAAGSVDLEVVGGENTIVNVVSRGTSFKNTLIKSKIYGALEANQIWAGTSFTNTAIEVVNDALLSNSFELGFTSFKNGSMASILQGGESALAYVHGTSLGSGSDIKIQNQAILGTELKTGVIHGTAGNLYRDYQGLIAGPDEVKVISGK